MMEIIISTGKDRMPYNKNQVRDDFSDPGASNSMGENIAITTAGISATPNRILITMIAILFVLVGVSF